MSVAVPRMPWGALPIGAITVLAGVLRLVALSGTQTNPYYDAAIRSMGQSWHNFFFAAFEPGGSVSIDKPPVDLWLQVASVKLFGWHATTLLLPEAIAGALAVPLLYAVVRRLFGEGPALASALALAVLPISVMTSRSDTMDSLMMALSVAAAWLVVRSAETGRKRHLLAAGAVMGIAFEVKLFEAMLALPALALLYLLADRTPVPRRVGMLAASLAVFLAFAVAWPVAVSLAPASSRPYAIGSTNGSVWNAIFVFNGTDRISPPSSGSSSPAPKPPPHRTAAPHRNAAPAPPHRNAAPAHPHRTAHPPPGPPRGSAAEVQGRISGSGEPPGVKRLFTLRGYFYGQNLGVELAAAILLGGLALLGGALAWLDRLALARRERLSGATHAPATNAGDAAAVARPATATQDQAFRMARAGAIAFAVWLIAGFVIFSRVKGVLHPRYLESMTPAVAVGLGAGLVVCLRRAETNVIGLLAFLGAFALSVAYALDVAAHDTTLTAVVTATAVAAAAATLVAAALPRLRPARARIATLALVAAAGLSLTSLLAPALARSVLVVHSKAQNAGSPGAEPLGWVRRVSDYLRAHNDNARYEFAASSYGQAGALIVHDGRPVMVLTGFNRRPIVKLAALERAAREGAVRYAVLNDSCGTASLSDLGPCARTIAWIRQHSVDVTAQLGIPQRQGVLFRITPPR